MLETNNFQDAVQPWHLYDPKTPLHHTVGRVKGLTKQVASQNRAPFLHRYLYQSSTPPCILSCFTTCVLYDNRTPANSSMVVRALHGNVRELLDDEAGRATFTPTEKLARTQALFLYQVMRLFDDNISLRSQAERDMPILETWLGELCKIRENLGNLGNEPTRNQEPIQWEVCLFILKFVKDKALTDLLQLLRGGSLQNPCEEPLLWHTRSSFCTT